MAPKDRISQAAGIVGFALLAVGAALYAINSPHRPLTHGTLIAGAAVLLVYLALNFGHIRTFSRSRSSRYGTNTAVMILLFAVIIIIIQAMSTRHHRRYDLTKNKRFSLSGQTLNVLEGLEKDVEIYGFYRHGAAERQPAEDLSSQYAYRSDRIRYEFIDPDQKPQRAQAMDVTSYGTLVVQYGDKREQISDITEETLTNAILKLTRDVVKVIYVVVGHGEKDPASDDPSGYSIMKEAVEKENYEVRTLSLFDEPSVPEDCQILVVAGPRKDYFESEVSKITDYLMAGNNAVFLMEPRVSLPNIEGLLALYRVVLDDVVIIDPYSRIFGGDYTVPVVTEYIDHPITKNLKIATFFPMARSVRIAPPEDDGVTAQYLARTGKSAWGETDLDLVKRGQAVRDEGDVPPPISLGLIAARTYHSGDPDSTRPAESKIVVFGDSDFADNAAFRISGNADLFLNVINFLAEEKDLVAIRPKRGLGDHLFLTASQGRLVFLLSVVVLPLSVMGFGVTVFMKKRRRG